MANTTSTTNTGKASARDAQAPAAEAARAAEGAERNFERTVAGLKDGVAAATAGFEQTQARVKQGMDKFIRTAEEMVAFGQGNFEAFLRSGQILTAGVQDLSRHLAASAQAAVDESVSGFKALTGVRSFKEAFEIQANLARASVERSLAETGKIAEASLKLAEQAAAPLAARVTLAVEKFARA